MADWIYENPKTIHRVPFIDYTDQNQSEFSKSTIYKMIAETRFVRIENGETISSLTCDIHNHNGPVYWNLKGDYDYLHKWYHNPYRKSNGRHGSYMMLDPTEEGGQVWRLNKAFVLQILSIPDNISDLFEYV